MNPFEQRSLELKAFRAEQELKAHRESQASLREISGKLRREAIKAQQERKKKDD